MKCLAAFLVFLLVIGAGGYFGWPYLKESRLVKYVDRINWLRATPAVNPAEPQSILSQPEADR